MVGLVLMTMMVVGGYVHLQKHRRAGTTSSTGSTTEDTDLGTIEMVSTGA